MKNNFRASVKSCLIMIGVVSPRRFPLQSRDLGSTTPHSWIGSSLAAKINQKIKHKLGFHENCYGIYMKEEIVVA